MPDSPIPGAIVPAPLDDPPIDLWEVEVGQRRAQRLAALVARLARTGTMGVGFSRTLLPLLKALSDRQCAMFERELDAALKDLAED